MLNLDLARNLATTPPAQLPAQLESIFSRLENQFNQMPSISTLNSRNNTLPPNSTTGDVVFDITGGELKIGVSNGQQIIYASLGSFTDTITDAQHGSRAGGTLHAEATGVLAGFLSSAFFLLLTKLSGFASLQNSTSPPSVTQLPNNGDWGFVHDTSAGKYYLAYNFAATVKSVELT